MNSSGVSRILIVLAVAWMASHACGQESFAPSVLVPQAAGAGEGASSLDGEIRFSQRPDVEPAPTVTGIDVLDRLSAAAAGRVQIETGYVYKRDRFAGERIDEHTLPDLLLRVGLTERLELRIGWPGVAMTRYEGPSGSDSSSHALNPNVGFMLDLWPQRGGLPQTALLVSVPIPQQGDWQALDSVQPLSQLLYAWYLSDRWSVGGTTGLALFDEYGDRYVQLQQTVNLDYLCTDRLGTFLEWETSVDHGSEDDGSQHLLGGGVAFLLTRRLQSSLRSGVGLNDRAPDFLAGIRFAYRF